MKKKISELQVLKLSLTDVLKFNQIENKLKQQKTFQQKKFGMNISIIALSTNVNEYLLD